MDSAALGHDERERLAFLEEAVTRENDGDPIWKFYDEKVWRSLQSWKVRAERYEAALREIRMLTVEVGDSVARRPHLTNRDVVVIRPVTGDRTKQARDFECQLLEGKDRSVATVKTLHAVSVRGTKTLITDEVGDAPTPGAVAHPAIVMRALLIAQSLAMLLWDKLAEVWVDRDELYARLRSPNPDQCQPWTRIGRFARNTSVSATGYRGRPLVQRPDPRAARTPERRPNGSDD